MVVMIAPLLDTDEAIITPNSTLELGGIVLQWFAFEDDLESSRTLQRTMRLLDCILLSQKNNGEMKRQLSLEIRR